MDQELLSRKTLPGEVPPEPYTVKNCLLTPTRGVSRSNSRYYKDRLEDMKSKYHALKQERSQEKVQKEVNQQFKQMAESRLAESEKQKINLLVEKAEMQSRISALEEELAELVLYDLELQN